MARAVQHYGETHCLITFVGSAFWGIVVESSQLHRHHHSKSEIYQLEFFTGD